MRKPQTNLDDFKKLCEELEELRKLVLEEFEQYSNNPSVISSFADIFDDIYLIFDKIAVIDEHLSEDKKED